MALKLERNIWASRPAASSTIMVWHELGREGTFVYARSWVAYYGLDGTSLVLAACPCHPTAALNVD